MVSKQSGRSYWRLPHINLGPRKVTSLVNEEYKRCPASLETQFIDRPDRIFIDKVAGNVSLHKKTSNLVRCVFQITFSKDGCNRIS